MIIVHCDLEGHDKKGALSAITFPSRDNALNFEYVNVQLFNESLRDLLLSFCLLSKYLVKWNL